MSRIHAQRVEHIKVKSTVRFTNLFPLEPFNIIFRAVPKSLELPVTHQISQRHTCKHILIVL